MEKRKGNQTPTQSYLLPHETSDGELAINLYEQTGRTAQDWQKNLIDNILATNDDGLWTHTKFGYSVPRRNGKNELIVMVELYALEHGLRVLHTAHRTTTSHTAWERLCKLYIANGHKEITRAKKGEEPADGFTSFKQYGLENVKPCIGEGLVNFRTRSSKGGLGEGYDILIIDEAQEYTDDQESALKYVVTDSKNPLTIMCGTPPTPISSGTVFTKYRETVLQGGRNNSGWAEWSVDEQSDCHDVELWYRCNPSLGTVFTERSVADEVGTDEIDFNIQRLGLWIKYNQHSAISAQEWLELTTDKQPELTGKMFVGIKYGHDGANVAMAIALKTTAGKTFVEAIDCRNVRDGNEWLLAFLMRAKDNIAKVAVDGASGQKLLAGEMKEAKLKAPVLPTVQEFIVANAKFEQLLFAKELQHANQTSLTTVITNCEKRAIGTNGGFGYKALHNDLEIALMDATILATWLCSEKKETKVQRISY